MTKELSEKEFIEMFSENDYQKIARWSYNEMRKSPEFKNDLPVVTSLMVFPFKHQNGTAWSLVIECNAKKGKEKRIGSQSIQPIDFGIHRIWVSDEDMPEVALDRYNEYMKVKEKTQNGLF